MLWVLAGGILGGVILTLFIFSHIDDWSRDLSTNVAATDGSSAQLQPLTLPLPTDQALEKLRQVVNALPGWQELAPQDHDPQASETIVVHLVRTTPLMRFKDDVYVRLEASDDGQSTTFHIRSQSRIGRGDLGQNPRNIRELLSRLAGVSS